MLGGFSPDSQSNGFLKYSRPKATTVFDMFKLNKA